jgi:hypothetical protein
MSYEIDGSLPYIYMYVRSNIDKVFNSQLTSIEGFNTAVLAYIVSFSE